MAALTPRIVVATAGHLSTTPRMLKAADALHAAGYRVRVVSANHTEWARTADAIVLASRQWASTIVDYSRATAPVARVASGARFKAAQRASATLGVDRVPIGLAVRAYSRAHDELVRAIVSEPMDVIYGGTNGALAAVADAAAERGVPYAIDLEDLHSAEHGGADAGQLHALASRIEDAAIRAARFVTASSPMISAAYAARYGVEPITIHNTFSINASPREPRPADAPLRLYWFSQTIGPGRGLEEVIRAAGHLTIRVELHLRGRPAGGYLEALKSLQREAAPSLSLIVYEPAGPDDMVGLAAAFDAGLSCEEPLVPNHRLCLGNKIFTYLAAGVPVVLSSTPAQLSLAEDLGDAAILYRCGDVDGLARALCALAAPARRTLTRRAARAAAERRWHWEHPLDRGALLAQVGSVAPLT
jgi:glycosyltransferase involved in cell wall biosynthesis